MAVFVVFWAGFRYGGWFYQKELAAERTLSEALAKERNELKTNLDLALGKAKALGLDAERIFPWLVLFCAVLLARGVV
jgi:hypothetical protein